MGWYCPPERIKNQSDATTCFGNALAMVTELYWEKKTGVFTKMSVASVSAFQPNPNMQADGLSIYDLAHVAIDSGVAEYDMLPYDLDDDKVFDYITDMKALEENASKYKYRTYEITKDVEKVKKALKKCPVLVATAISREFMSYRSYNAKMISDFDKHGETFYGWHFMTISDDIEEENCFQLINSYGRYWGKDGTCLMPYDYNDYIPLSKFLILTPYEEVEEVNNVKEQLLSLSRPFESLKPEGFVIHSTATPGATAQNEYIYFNREHRLASAHYFVDWQEIIRAIPENEKAWHSGSIANSKYLSVEMSEPKGIDKVKFDEVWKKTVWLVADACVRYGWTIKNVFSHKLMSEKYRETNHVDPIPYFTQYGKTWEKFLQDVDREIKRMKGLGDVVNKAILIFSQDDLATAKRLQGKIGNCAIFFRNSDATAPSDVKNVKQLFVVGGSGTVGHSNEVLLQGKDWFETAKKVGEYINNK